MFLRRLCWASSCSPVPASAAGHELRPRQHSHWQATTHEDLVRHTLDGTAGQRRDQQKSTMRLASTSSSSVRFMIAGLPLRNSSPMRRASLATRVQGCDLHRVHRPCGWAGDRLTPAPSWVRADRVMSDRVSAPIAGRSLGLWRRLAKVVVALQSCALFQSRGPCRDRRDRRAVTI